MRNPHSVDIIKEFGLCGICQQPFHFYWMDSEKKVGGSEQYEKISGKYIHLKCLNVKSL